MQAFKIFLSPFELQLQFNLSIQWLIGLFIKLYLLYSLKQFMLNLR